MACKLCQSENQKEFNAEINIHFPGRTGLDKAPVLVFPMLVVCLDCGFTECAIPADELHRLSKDTAA